MESRRLACCYTRFSTDHQNESSTIGQLRAIKAYCEKNSIELIDTYIDEAQTGTNMNRTNFQRLLADAPTAIWDTVVVYNMSRLSRSVKDTLIIKEQFKKMGKTILSVIENQDDTPEGEFFNLITYGLNELFVKQFKRDSWRGMLVNANDCKVQGGVPLYGYSVGPDRKYIINEEEAKVVKLIFDRIVDGYSYRDIANELNSKSITNRGRPFKIHFTEMLQNEKYKGIYIWNLREGKDKLGTKTNRIHKKESEVIRIKDGMPRIIDDETFEKVQEILRSRRKRHAGPKTKYLLSGIIRCGTCGRAFSGGYSFSGLTKCYRSYYKCTSKQSPSIKCNNRDINKDNMDLYIRNLVKFVILKVDNANVYKNFINEYIDRNNEYIKREIVKVELQLKEIINASIELANRLANASETDYVNITKLIGINATERTRLDLELRKLKEYVLNDKTTKLNVEDMMKSVRKQYLPNESKDILHRIINKIIMYDDTIETYVDLTYMFNLYDYLNEDRVLLCIKEKRVNVTERMKMLDIDYTSEKLDRAMDELLRKLPKL